MRVEPSLLPNDRRVYISIALERSSGGHPVMQTVNGRMHRDAARALRDKLTVVLEETASPYVAGPVPGSMF